MRWRLILEDFSPKLIYIKGSENIAADALSCLDKTDNLKDYKVELTLESQSENFALNNEYINRSTSFKTIIRFQHKDLSLIKIAFN